MKTRNQLLRYGLVIIPAMLLGGCLEPMSGRPSLARRDIELRDRQAEAQRQVSPNASVIALPQPVLDPVLARDIAAIMVRADQAEADFATARTAAEQSVKSAARTAMGSDAWSVAQTRISALDSPRRELGQLLGDLETLYIARLEQEAAGTIQPGGSAQIDQSRNRLLALIAAQDRILDAMKTALAS